MVRAAPPPPRYMSTKVNEYWSGDVEAALQPHPVVVLSAGQALNTPELTS